MVSIANVGAKGGCAKASTLVRHRPGRLELEVLADRPVSRLAARLAPVRERVDLYGGHMTAGGDTHFAVHCQLPLEVVDSR